MRLIGLRLPILAVLMLASSSVPTRAQVLYLETADWLPTASVLALPTSYVVAGTYAVPTSYTIPTVYATAYVTESALLAPTTYVAPTYYETRFRRGGLFGRRLVETTRAYYLPTTAYYPTTYYYPTTFYPTTYYYPTTFSSPTVLDTSVVSTGYTTARSSNCCGGETIVAAAPAVRMYPSEQTPVATTPAPRTNTRSRTSPIQSEPAEDDSINSNVPELPPREPAPRSDASGAAAGRSDSPPPSPFPRRSPGGSAQPKPASPNMSPTSPASSGGVERPTAPVGPEDLEPAPGSGETSGAGSGGRRVVQKPVLPASREVRSQYRNVLFGRVKTRDTNEPEEGVRVTISNRTNAYADRVALTDAFGRFAVKVPDGDWTVNVTMPSGRAYSVSQITVSNGLINDDIGRDIPSLVITR
ncbi:MAG: carboxypeptidase regulatory-like domain-containing protein [Isosphaeraceae bacterium]